MKQRQVIFVKAEEVIEEVAKLCKSFHAKEIILYGSTKNLTEYIDLFYAFENVVKQLGVCKND